MTCELLDIIILFSNDSLQLVGLRLERKERKIKKEKFQKKLKNVLVKCSRMGDILTPETSFSITSLKKKTFKSNIKSRTNTSQDYVRIHFILVSYVYVATHLT